MNDSKVDSCLYVEQPTHQKKLIELNTSIEDWKKYSLWGRFGMRIGQIIGLIEINIK